MTGIKGIVPAALILALAYCINTLSKDMHTAQYIVSITETWMSPMLLPLLLFLVTGFISFATGTAWELMQWRSQCTKLSLSVQWELRWAR